MALAARRFQRFSLTLTWQIPGGVATPLERWRACRVAWILVAGQCRQATCVPAGTRTVHFRPVFAPAIHLGWALSMRTLGYGSTSALARTLPAAR